MSRVVPPPGYRRGTNNVLRRQAGDATITLERRDGRWCYTLYVADGKVTGGWGPRWTAEGAAAEAERALEEAMR